MAERARQTRQHHLLPAEVLPQATGFGEVFLDVIAVGAQHDHLAAPDQIGQRERNTFAVQFSGPHLDDTVDMVAVHAVQNVGGEGAQQIPVRTRCKQQSLPFVLHRAVVCQGCGIEPDAVKTDFPAGQLANPFADRGGIKTGVEKRVAHRNQPMNPGGSRSSVSMLCRQAEGAF